MTSPEVFQAATPSSKDAKAIGEPRAVPGAWLALTLLICINLFNYLDRQVLATMVDIWRTRPEFPFTYDDYGVLLSVFSLAYALSALFIGWFIDRVGLNRGAAIAVAVWAMASIGTGMSHRIARSCCQEVPP